MNGLISKFGERSNLHGKVTISYLASDDQTRRISMLVLPETISDTLQSMVLDMDSRPTVFIKPVGIKKLTIGFCGRDRIVTPLDLPGWMCSGTMCRRIGAARLRNDRGFLILSRCRRFHKKVETMGSSEKSETEASSVKIEAGEHVDEDAVVKRSARKRKREDNHDALIELKEIPLETQCVNVIEQQAVVVDNVDNLFTETYELESMSSFGLAVWRCFDPAYGDIFA